MTKTKPFEFQKAGVVLINQFNGRVILADQMGLGKTLQALLYLQNYRNKCPAIVVCPSTAKWVWMGQAKEHVGMKSRIINGKQAKKLKTERSLIIINYEILEAWVSFLKKLKPKTIILDEAHYTKNSKAIRTKAVQALCKNVPHIIAISGTPIVNRPKEIYNTLKILDPIKWKYYVSFAEKYCDRKFAFWGGGWDDNGCSNPKTLGKLLRRTCMIRRLKKDVLKELPPKTRVVIPLPLSNPKEYIRAESDFAGWLKETAPEKVAGAMKAMQLVKVGALLTLAAQLKMKSVITWIGDFLEETDEKLVLFAEHKIIIKELYDHYSKISVVLDGSTPQNKRKNVVEQFNDNKKTKIFIGNIIAAGTVISLKASTLAFIEMNPVPGNHTQAEDRIHGIGRGTKKNALIYYLVTKGTIESDLCKIIQHKAKVISAIIDGGDKTSELNVYNKLMKLISKRNLL